MPDLEISLAQNLDDELAAKAQLERLLQTYDLSRWTFTHQIRIEKGSVPHSHPVLTLDTRYLNDDDSLLATYIHEQLHWFSFTRPEAVRSAIETLEQIYPTVPVGPPDGARSEFSTYLHLVICYLEYRAVAELTNLKRARKVAERRIARGVYAFVYREILAKPEVFQSILEGNHLLL